MVMYFITIFRAKISFFIEKNNCRTTRDPVFKYI